MTVGTHCRSGIFYPSEEKDKEKRRVSGRAIKNLFTFAAMHDCDVNVGGWVGGTIDCMCHGGLSCFVKRICRRLLLLIRDKQLRRILR